MSRRGARAPHNQARRRDWSGKYRPFELAELKLAILDAIADGPKTRGELVFHFFNGLKAATRDEAIASLVQSRKVCLVRVPHPVTRGATLEAIALRGKEARRA